MSFRNRCVVAGSNGLVNLSVPVENGRGQKLPYRDVRISYSEDWQKLHWRTLTSCYNKSAFFDYYRDSLEKLFLERKEFLFDMNLEILSWLKSQIRFPAEIEVLNEPTQVEEDAAADDFRDRWLPKNFQEAQIRGQASYPKYFQVFEGRIGFQPNLSILDLLFNEGPNVRQILNQG